ncbi:hypothetical protein [Pseudomonas corrugata]|uniref:hypothetical protein n=1 Tax=Pseudomonas corrugata TaxID=47879 RepID=UPI001586C46D|nr:hypothetical protein [Pseudomonas corrugata]MCI0996040.1 hypothetical protein [Pseudomonas corrugata]NUT67959.1 hypothetical protein [Pseudomonas corrugata]
MPRSKRLITLFVALLGVAGLWYMWILASAKLEWGGASPDRQQLGAVKDTRLRAMTQYCTGVAVTGQSTWLVGRLDGDANQLKPGAEVVNLDAVVYGRPKAPEPGGYYANLIVREEETSFISRLDAQGQFQLVAHVSGAACLVASPDGASVFLLTGLDRPEGANADDVSQTVVLRSDDQGKHWTWLSKGWFAGADSLAWNLKPYFHGADEVWAWGQPATADDFGGETTPGVVPTGVFYSADRGMSSTPIVASESLLVSAESVHEKHPGITEWRTDLGEQGEVRTNVLQLDDRHAFIWVSQRFWASNPDGVSNNLAFNLTTRARLQREAGEWRVVEVQREDNLFVSMLIQNDSGRVIGLIDQGNGGRDVIAELDTGALTWRTLSELPSPFAPLASESRVREEHFWVGQNSLLINTTSAYHPPRWLYWWSDATISADGVFYSNDWGQSWKRLAIDGYLGIVGFQPAQDRVIWGKGNWFDNYDGGLYSYGLH